MAFSFPDDAVFTALGDDVVVNGVPTQGFFSAAHAGMFGTDDVLPQVVVRGAETAGLTSGAPVVVNGVSYSVRAIQPDGTGLSTLVLQET